MLHLPVKPSAPQGDPRQRAALAAIVRFFALLLVLTLVARGTAGATMPVVTTTHPASGRVSKTLSAAGAVASDPGVPFTLPEGLLVTAVKVKAGESVHTGDVLAAFDAAEVAQTITAAQANLAKLQVQADQLAKGKAADNFAVGQAQDALRRSYDSYHKTDADGQTTVGEAEAARDSAASALQNLKDHPPADPGALATPEQATAESAKSEWQNNVAAAEAALQQAEDAVTAAEKSASAALDGALSSAQAAEDGRDSALHGYRKEAADLADTNTLNRADAGVLRADIAKAKTDLQALRDLQDDGCNLLAGADGTLTALDLKPGVISPAVGGLIAGADAGYTLTATLTEEQAKLVTVGDALRVTQGKNDAQQAAVATLSAPDEEGAVTVTANLPAGNWKSGAAAFTITTQGAESSLCLPATAVNTDSTGSYVYLVEERNTVLGLQNVLVRVPVTVLAQGDSTVSVSGAVDSGSVIVSGSSKPLSDGAKVRLKG